MPAHSLRRKLRFGAVDQVNIHRTTLDDGWVRWASKSQKNPTASSTKAGMISANAIGGTDSINEESHPNEYMSSAGGGGGTASFVAVFFGSGCITFLSDLLVLSGKVSGGGSNRGVDAALLKLIDTDVLVSNRRVLAEAARCAARQGGMVLVSARVGAAVTLL